MEPERWQKVNAMFEAALEQPAESRSAFLLEACGGDHQLFAEVESLLVHSQTQNHWAGSIVPALAAEMESATEGDFEDKHVGPYRLTRVMGVGGMGVVYEGERDDAQLDMRVAVKVIKPGLDTMLLLRRFRAERQILANLQHANIARLLDAGSTSDGRPYLVMEFVDGVPITAYCQKQALPVADRLTLFLAVCDAVGYAHRRLVVHCDLKPSNILVSAEGQVKLLDFGVARLVSADGAAEGTVTALVAGMLTPAYASPEQIRRESVSTASDVYSLGVILHELLTGNRPYDLSSLPTARIEETICETEPVKPSLTAGVSLKLSRQLAGDLDNIVLHCLRKEPENRYRSPGDLADDLRRHLSGQAVQASPPSLRYRCGKFVRRHRLAVATTAVAVATLLAGSLAVAWQARRAEHRFQQVRHLANRFLFDFHEKIERLPGATEARQMVVQTGIEYLESLEKDAGSDASLLREIGAGYAQLAQIQSDIESANLDAANATAEKARRILEPLYQREPTDRDTAYWLTMAYDISGFTLLGAGDTTGSIEWFEKAERIIGGQLARDPLDTRALLRSADIRLVLAQLLDRQGKMKESVMRAQQANKALTLLVTLDKAPQFRDMLAASHTTMANAAIRLGDFEEAVAHDRAGVALREQRLAESPNDASTMRQLLIAYSGLGDDLTDPLAPVNDPAAALPYYEKMRDLAERLMQEDPASRTARVDAVHAYSRVGGALAESHRGAEALPWLLKARDLTTEILKADPKQFGLEMRGARVEEQIAQVLFDLGRMTESLDAASRSVHMTDSLVSHDPKHTGARRQQLMSSRTQLGLLASSSPPAQIEAAINRLRTLVAEAAGIRTTDRSLQIQTPLAYYVIASSYGKLSSRTGDPRYVAAACDAYREARSRWDALKKSNPSLRKMDDPPPAHCATPKN